LEKVRVDENAGNESREWEAMKARGIYPHQEKGKGAFWRYYDKTFWSHAPGKVG
jgi:hypothetical protein